MIISEELRKECHRWEVVQGVEAVRFEDTWHLITADGCATIPYEALETIVCHYGALMMHPGD